ncbi:hypothetical protein [Nitratireductor rhodophyticola]
MKSLYHDLLERALPILMRSVASDIECSCTLARDDAGNFPPVPGTCELDQVGSIEADLDLIRDIESEIGTGSVIIPAWLQDLLDRRWSLT